MSTSPDTIKDAGVLVVLPPFRQWLVERYEEIVADQVAAGGSTRGCHAALGHAIGLEAREVKRILSSTEPTVARATVEQVLTRWNDGTTYEDLVVATRPTPPARCAPKRRRPATTAARPRRTHAPVARPAVDDDDTLSKKEIAAIAAEAAGRTNTRSDFLEQVTLYADLRREVDPGYQLARVYSEISAGIGCPVAPDSSEQMLARALAWIRERTAAYAASHPSAVQALVQTRRRQTVATAGL